MAKQREQMCQNYILYFKLDPFEEITQEMLYLAVLGACEESYEI